jgi:hypothetical protein
MRAAEKEVIVLQTNKTPSIKILTVSNNLLFIHNVQFFWRRKRIWGTGADITRPIKGTSPSTRHEKQRPEQ